MIYHRKTGRRHHLRGRHRQPRPALLPTSRDAYVLTTNPADVAAISATFTTDFTAPAAGRPRPQPLPRLVWSPDARAVFLQRITNAAQTLNITSEELKDPPKAQPARRERHGSRPSAWIPSDAKHHSMRSPYPAPHRASACAPNRVCE